MYSNQMGSLEEVDKLQANLRSILKDALDRVESLEIQLSQKCEQYEKLAQLMDGCKKMMESQCCMKCNGNLLQPFVLENKPIVSNDVDIKEDFKQDVRREALHADVLKEIEDLSSLELDTQFVPDVLLCNEIKPPSAEITERKTRRSARIILEEMFGPATQSSSDGNYVPGGKGHASQPIALSTTDRDHVRDEKSTVDYVLAENSPIRPQSPAAQGPRRFIPETLTQALNEMTPPKCTLRADDRISELDVANGDRLQLLSGEFAGSSPRSALIRVTPTRNLMPAKKARLDTSQLVTPSRCSSSETDDFNSITPKKKVSPKKTRTPRKSRTPKNPLKKTHRIEPEISHHGVRKLTQTQLNIETFKKARSHENSERSFALTQDSPVSVHDQGFYNVQKVEDTGDIDTPTLKEEMTRLQRPSTPLHCIENSPDLDETNLSASAYKRIAGDVILQREVKHNLSSSYDRVPEKLPLAVETRREMRRRLPGLVCQDCVRWHEDCCARGEETNLQEALDKCSRHRTKAQPPDTPVGFWKVILTPTQPQPSSQ